MTRRAFWTMELWRTASAHGEPSSPGMPLVCTMSRTGLGKRWRLVPGANLAAVKDEHGMVAMTPMQWLMRARAHN